MLRLIHIATLNGIDMNILNFLPHHHHALNNVRVNTLLPKLAGSITLMRFFIKRQLIQDGFGVFLLQTGEKLL